MQVEGVQTAFTSSFRRPQQAYLVLRGCRLQGHLRAPDEADPLHHVVGQTGPQRLGAGFHQPSKPKLPDPQFLLDPGIGKLRQRTPLLIDLPGFLTLHLLPKRCHLFPFSDQHRNGSPPSRILWAALRTMFTTLAVAARGLILMVQITALFALPYIWQDFAGRALQSPVLRMHDEK